MHAKSFNSGEVESHFSIIRQAIVSHRSLKACDLLELDSKVFVDASQMVNTNSSISTILGV